MTSRAAFNVSVWPPFRTALTPVAFRPSKTISLTRVSAMMVRFGRRRVGGSR